MSGKSEREQLEQLVRKRRLDGDPAREDTRELVRAAYKLWGDNVDIWLVLEGLAAASYDRGAQSVPYDERPTRVHNVWDLQERERGEAPTAPPHVLPNGVKGRP